MNNWRSLFTAGLLLVSACATSDQESSALAAQRVDPQDATVQEQRAIAEAAREAKTMEERRALRRLVADPKYKKFEERPNLESVAAGSVTGEVPEEMLEKVIDDLAAKIDVDRSALEVVQAESLTYNDGSLGCGEPGQNYTQSIVPGYRIVLAHDGQLFDYRATAKGYFKLCEQPMLVSPGTGGKPPIR